MAALLGLSAVLALVLEDPAPAVLPLLLALPLRRRADFGKWRRTRWTRADIVAFVMFITALGLTLLIPDGLLRWIVSAALVMSYIASVRLLNPDG